MMGYGFMQDGLRHVCCVCIVRQYHVDLPRPGIIPALGRSLSFFKSFGAFMYDYSAAKVEVLGGFLRGLAYLNFHLSDGFFKSHVTVAEHNAAICNIFVRNFGIYKIFDYLCRSIKVLLIYFLLNILGR
mgnify:CR=1 FL=1